MADSASAFIQWNLPNWITVFLMGAVGFVVLGFLAHALKGGMGGQ